MFEPHLYARWLSAALCALALGAAGCKKQGRQPQRAGSAGSAKASAAAGSGNARAAAASGSGSASASAAASGSGSASAASAPGGGSGSGSAGAGAVTPPVTPHKAEIKPTNKRPGTRVIQRVAAKVALGVRAHDRGKSLGGTRWVSAISGRKKKGEAFTTFLVLLDEQGGQWKLLGSREVAQQNRDESGMCPTRLPVSIFTSDYDHDGKVEVLLRYRTCSVEPVVGQSTNTYMMIFNAHRALTVALSSTELQASAGSGGTVVKTSHVDVNEDGFPDLRVRATSKGTWADDKGGNTTVTVYLYDPKTDSYAIKKRKRKGRKKAATK